MAAEAQALEMTPAYWLGIAHDRAFSAVVSLSPVPRIRFHVGNSAWLICFSYAFAADVVRDKEDRAVGDVRLTWSSTPSNACEGPRGCLYGYTSNTSKCVPIPTLTGDYRSFSEFVGALVAVSTKLLAEVHALDDGHGH